MGTIQHEVRNDILVLRIGGRFDFETYEDLVGVLRRELYPTRRKGVVVNLAGVTMITSSGISALAKLSMERPMRVAAPRPVVSELLDLSGVTSIIEVMATEEDALKAFPGR